MDFLQLLLLFLFLLLFLLLLLTVSGTDKRGRHVLYPFLASGQRLGGEVGGAVDVAGELSHVLL
jgi:hypothetical protein